MAVDRTLIADAGRWGDVLSRLDGGFSWTYFGRDTAGLARLQARIGERGAYRAANARLQSHARERQAEFLDLMAAPEPSSLEDWTDPLREMNPEVSRLFFHACCALAAKSLAAEGKGAWVFFAESPALRRVLARELPGVERVWDAAPLARAVRRAKETAYALAHRARMVADHLWSLWLMAVVHGPHRSPAVRKALASAKPLTLLFTWVHDRSFPRPGEFRDHYLMGLGEELRARGENVLVVPRIMPVAARGRALREMRRSSTGFLNMAPYLGFGAVARRVFTSFGEFFRRQGPAGALGGVDLSDLAREDARETRLYPRTAEAKLYYDLAAGWKRAGLNIGRFIFPYENHGWEKALCAGLKAFHPDAVTVGYQHGRLPEVLPNYYRSPKDGSPGPDLVVANGPGFRRRLVASGYDPARTLSAGTLRYRYITAAGAGGPPPKKAGGPALLAAFPIGLDESRELYWRVSEALRDETGLAVWMKFHPDAPYDRVARGWPEADMPKHFILTEEPMDALVKTADLVVYTTSTSSLEAAAAGARPLHYVIGSNIDGDPLDFAPGLAEHFETPAELRGIVKREAAKGFPRLDPARVGAMIRDVFGGPEEDIMPLFLSSKAGGRP